MNRDRRFLQREYVRNLIPLMFSVLGGTINSLIDSLFVSRRLGTEGLAAVNMSMPVYLIMCSIGALIAAGGFMRSARAAGADNMPQAVCEFRTAHTLLAICGVIFTVFGILLCRPIADVLAQGGGLAGMIYSYCLVSFIGALPTIFIYLPLFYLQLEGKGRQISRMIAIMVVADAVMDLIFLYPLGMGMAGAALASVLSTLIACVYGMRVLQDKESNYPRQRKLEKPTGIKKLLLAGSPTALGNLCDALKLLAVNALILYAAGPEDTAVWAILNVLSELSLIIVSGVPQTAAPMIAVFSSSKENSGIRILTSIQLRIGLILTGAFAGVVLILTVPIERSFSLERPMLVPLVCLGLSVVGNLVGSIWAAVFTGTGRIRTANLIGILRRLVTPVVCLAGIILCNGYLWAFLPVSAALTILVSLAVVLVKSRLSSRTERPLSPLLLLDDTLERQHKVIDFSIGADMESACTASEQIQGFCLENQMDKKATTRMGLSIEELLGVIVQNDKNLQSVDMRAYALDGVTGIRIRYAGERYNPFDKIDEDEDLYMGIAMLQKMSEMVTHTYTLGMNIVNILYR